MPIILNKSVDSEQLGFIAKNYNTLQYSPQLLELLAIARPQKKYDNFSKFSLHKEINNILLKYYGGEFEYKYALFSRFANSRLVGAFEMKVNNSRADFVTINGHTSSFEIKTNRDNLGKLAKQSFDYLSTFEYNYIVLDPCHLEKAKQLLPDNYGIWIYREGLHKLYRKAKLSHLLNPSLQLQQLTKREITLYFKCATTAEVLEKHTTDQINTGFKTILKGRYNKRWSFIVEHSQSILPIDVQYFFSSSISPKLIYGK